MAVITPERLELPNSNAQGFNGVEVHQWRNFAVGDTFLPVQSPKFTERSVIVEGAFSGSTVTMAGNNGYDTDTYFALNDRFGASLAFTVAGLRSVNEMTINIKPVITLGTGSAMTVTLLISRLP